jgi:hypothetical protein
MQKNIYKTSPRGFIALTSAVIVAAMLMVVLVAGSMSGFYERGVALDAELKARSEAAANACAQRAVLYLQGPGYAGGNYRLNSMDECMVGAAAESGSQITFKVQGISGKAAITNIEVTYDPQMRTIMWQKEIPTY